MKSVRSLALAIAMGAVCAPAMANQDSQHQGHHPTDSSVATAKNVAPDPAPAATPALSSQDMAGMDAHMKAMQEMHEKMMAAKTPEQRKALMAEHMKLMQGGMKMMGDMSPGGAGAMKCDTGEQHGQMEKRMQMLQSMMQMMMDRMPATSKD